MSTVLQAHVTLWGNGGFCVSLFLLVFPKGQNHFTQNAVRLRTCSEPGQAHRPPSGTSCTSQTPRSLRSHQARRGQAMQHTGDGSPCALPRSVGEVASGSQQSNEPALGHQPGWPSPSSVSSCPSVPSSAMVSVNSQRAPTLPKHLPCPQRHGFLERLCLQPFLSSVPCILRSGHPCCLCIHAYMHTHTSAWCGGLLAHHSQGPLLSRGSAHLLLLTSTLNTHTH